MKSRRIFLLAVVFFLWLPFVGKASAADLQTIIHSRVSAYNGDEEQTAWITQAILYASSLYQVDPLLVTAVMQAESQFNINVGYSRAGAIGLMQLMPGTAEMIGVNPYNPGRSISGRSIHPESNCTGRSYGNSKQGFCRKLPEGDQSA